MARRGLNCTLTYAPRTGGTRRGYRVRCKSLSFGFQMVASESQAKDTRAFYPYKTAPTQFTVSTDVMGAAERISLNRFMMGYADAVLNADTNGRRLPMLTVTMPSRNFRREGVLLSGWEWGTRVGEMVWTHDLVFQTSREPLDWNAKAPTLRVQTILSTIKDPASQYFYPSGVQLSGGQSSAIQAAVGGTAKDIFDGIADVF